MKFTLLSLEKLLFYHNCIQTKVSFLHKSVNIRWDLFPLESLEHKAASKSFDASGGAVIDALAQPARSKCKIKPSSQVSSACVHHPQLFGHVSICLIF